MSAQLNVDRDLTRAKAQRLLTEVFISLGLETPALDARILLCAALQIDHASLVRDPDLPLGQHAGTLEGFARRRMAREPVSRILGQREFFGEIYRVDAFVLDPRPDTETLVEAVLAELGTRRNEALRLLDLGTGSGAILGALLHALPETIGFGIDRSPDACFRAKGNFSALGLANRAMILAGDWMAPLAGRFDVIVSNPPYIESAVIEALDPEVKFYDPRLALDGGADGLDAYRAIITPAVSHLAYGGLLAFELGEGQFSAVESLLRAAGFKQIIGKRDLAGRDRVILAGLEIAR